jgi:hypothetical protein
LLTWAISNFSYSIRAAAASARIPKELVAWLTSAAPVYATNVDDVVLVTAPVPEAVVHSVVFREMDVTVLVATVDVTLDAVVEGPVVVLEPFVLVLELFVVELEEVGVELEEVEVELKKVEVELDEVVTSVQLLEAKAATPSANAASKGAANAAARDWASAGTRATMALMRAWEAVCIPVTWKLISSHSPVLSNADFFAIRSLTSEVPRACKASTGASKVIALLRVRLPLPVTVFVPLSMVACRVEESLSIVDESLAKALTAESSVDIPEPTASRTLVMVGTSRSTSVGSRLTRIGSAAIPRAKVTNGKAVMNLILMR